MPCTATQRLRAASVTSWMTDWCRGRPGRGCCALPLWPVLRARQRAEKVLPDRHQYTWTPTAALLAGLEARSDPARDASLALPQNARSALSVRPLPPALLAQADRLAADPPSIPEPATGASRQRSDPTLRAARLLGLSEVTKVPRAGAEGRADQARRGGGAKAAGGREARERCPQPSWRARQGELSCSQGPHTLAG